MALFHRHTKPITILIKESHICATYATRSDVQQKIEKLELR